MVQLKQSVQDLLPHHTANRVLEPLAYVLTHGFRLAEASRLTQKTSLVRPLDGLTWWDVSDRSWFLYECPRSRPVSALTAAGRRLTAVPGCDSAQWPQKCCYLGELTLAEKNRYRAPPSERPLVRTTCSPQPGIRRVSALEQPPDPTTLQAPP
jgi:hypothetical protein